MFETGYSMVKSYRRCPKQYEFKYIRNLQRKRPAPPLIRGTILHELLDARALRSMKKATRTAKSILNAYAEKFGSLFREERETYGDSFLEDIGRVWDNYERAYKDDGWKYEASEEELTTELEKGIIFKGHLDKRVITKDRRWIVDHKTHKTIPTEEARFNDYQILLYLWTYNREVPKGERADGLIWDYLRTKPPTIPEPLKKGGLSIAQNQDTDYFTYSTELSKLKLDPKPYAEFLASLKKRSATKFFLRVPLPEPSTEMTQQVVEDVKITTISMRDAKHFPRNPTRDCSWCEYYRLCSSELRGLDSKFIEKTEFEEKVIGDENTEED
jgi:RecB family exonuclease